MSVIQWLTCTSSCSNNTQLAYLVARFNAGHHFIAMHVHMLEGIYAANNYCAVPTVAPSHLVFPSGLASHTKEGKTSTVRSKQVEKATEVHKCVVEITVNRLDKMNPTHRIPVA